MTHFVARAKTKGKCAYKPCPVKADRIFEDEHWRVLACCNDHAELVLSVVNQFPRDLVKKVYFPNA